MGIIGNRIKKLRKARGLSQEELGFELGVSRQTVLKWENNVMRPNAVSLKMLCEFFNVSMDAILSDESEVACEEVVSSSENNSEEAPQACKTVSGKGKLLYVTLAIISALFFVASAMFTTISGFVVFSDNVGIDRTTTNSIDNAAFFICLILSVVFLVLSILFSVRAARTTKVN